MKNILLIGGSYGIGHAIAARLSKDCTVYIASRTTPERVSPNITHIVFDAGSDTLDTTLLPQTLDGFVYLPGTINLRPFQNIKAEAFEIEFKINFTDMVRVLQTVFPKLLAVEQASIVLFSSIAATSGMPFHTSVAASKAAVEGFARSLAAEYAPKIRVNVVAPSLTQTPLTDKFLNTDVKQQRSRERNPMGRFGNVEDIAAMANFLLREDSQWISGQVFHVDGGLSRLIVNP